MRPGRWVPTISPDDFTRRFKTGAGIGNTIVDQVNFQISCFENLHTQVARSIAQPMVEFTQAFVVQLEAEVVSVSPSEFSV